MDVILVCQEQASEPQKPTLPDAASYSQATTFGNNFNAKLAFILRPSLRSHLTVAPVWVHEHVCMHGSNISWCIYATSAGMSCPTYLEETALVPRHNAQDVAELQHDRVCTELHASHLSADSEWP